MRRAIIILRGLGCIGFVSAHLLFYTLGGGAVFYDVLSLSFVLLVLSMLIPSFFIVRPKCLKMLRKRRAWITWLLFVLTFALGAFFIPLLDLPFNAIDLCALCGFLIPFFYEISTHTHQDAK